MKVRKGFVTNSSSSSFIIGKKEEKEVTLDEVFLAIKSFYLELVDKSNQLIDYCKEPRSRKEIADFLGIDTVYYVMDKYINPLLQKDLLKMTYPDKPKSKKQKYYSSY